VGANPFQTQLQVGLLQIRIQSRSYFQTNSFDYHTVPGTNVRIVVAPTGALAVQVRDANGQGIGAWQDRPLQVSIEAVQGAVRGSWGGSATLHADGTYLFTGVHPGTYTLKLLNTSRQATTTVAPNQVVDVKLQLP
jgi:hypothetical protein